MIKLDFNNFKAIWCKVKKDEEIGNYIPEEKDLFFIINGYLFIVQVQDGFNNIIMVKLYRTKPTLKRTLHQFKNCLKENGIQYIRVEGTKKRYNFLSHMFRDVIHDTGEFERNVFYVKIY